MKCQQYLKHTFLEEKKKKKRETEVKYDSGIGVWMKEIQVMGSNGFVEPQNLSKTVKWWEGDAKVFLANQSKWYRKQDTPANISENGWLNSEQNC